MIDIQTVNSQIDLIQLVEQAGSHLHRAGSEWRGNCPLHGGDNKNGFAVYDNGRLWQCFTSDCGGGDALRFIMKLKNVGLVEAAKIALGDRAFTEEDLDRIRIEAAERAARDLEEKIREAQDVLRSLQDSKIWIKYHSNLQNDFDGRILWAEAGIPEVWQDLWQLGYDPKHTVYTELNQFYTSPTLTIPIFDRDRNCVNVRHRILEPREAWDKYRPERAGLPPNIFIADPDLKDPAAYLIVEGEKKAMVTYLTIDNPGVQALGLAGKNVPYELIEKNIEGSAPVYLIYDPDAVKQAEKTASRIGKDRARIVDLPMKIDDLILQAGIDKTALRNLFKQSRRL